MTWVTELSYNFVPLTVALVELLVVSDDATTAMEVALDVVFCCSIWLEDTEVVELDDVVLLTSTGFVVLITLF